MSKIDIHDILPLMRTGWVVYHPNTGWMWTPIKPRVAVSIRDFGKKVWASKGGCFKPLDMFSIRPYKGNWENTIIRVANYRREVK